MFVVLSLGVLITFFLLLVNWPLSLVTGSMLEPLSDNIPRFLVYFFGGFISYCGAIYFLRKDHISYQDMKIQKLAQQDVLGGTSYNSSRKRFIVLILLTLLMRVPFLLSHPLPELSDDIYRYWWDGKVQSTGINPYQYSPKDFPKDILNDQDKKNLSKVNHPEIPTIYAPVLQMIFYISYSIHPSIQSIKIVFIFFDLLTILFLILWLKKLVLPKDFFIIYAWNPLVIVEFYHNGHADSLLCLLIVLLLYLYHSDRKRLSLVMLAFLTLTKYVGLIFLPFYYKKVSLRYFGVYFIIIGLFYLYYYDQGIFKGLLIYSHYWEYNSFLYKGLYTLLDDKQIPKIVLGVLFLVLYFKKWQEVIKNDFLFGKSFFVILGAVLLFSPTLHPWYVIIILPVLVVYFSRSWILFSGLVILSYVSLIGYDKSNPASWSENIYVLFIEYIPFYGLLLYDYYKRKMA